jgi:hypothetical protein
VEDGGPVGAASRVFASGNNPQFIQPSNNISSLSPGGTYSLMNPNSNSLHQSDPLGDGNVKLTEVLPLSRQMPNINHKKVLAVQSLLKASDDPQIIEQLEAEASCEDIDEDDDDFSPTQVHKKFYVPNTPGSIQGGSRNLMKNSLMDRMPQSQYNALLKYSYNKFARNEDIPLQ